MGEDRLNDMAILYTEKDIFNQINSDHLYAFIVLNPFRPDVRYTGHQL